MVNQKRKDQIGRSMLVDAIKESGITENKDKIDFLTLPSSSCKDVLLLNKIFGEENVTAVGYERNSNVYKKGYALAPKNLLYRFDSTGTRFMRDAVRLASIDLYNVIDFEFCGYYGSPNHADIDTLMKVVAAKIALGKPAVIGATYSVSCSHHGKITSVRRLKMPRLESMSVNDDGSIAISPNKKHPIKWWEEPFQWENRDEVWDEQINGYEAASAPQRYNKRKALALAQAIKIRLNQALFANFPPNQKFQVPFSVKADCYGGGADGGEMMLRIMIIANPSRGWNNDNAHDGTYFHTSNFPTTTETKTKYLANFISFWTKNKHPEDLSYVGDEFYSMCESLFGMSRYQVAAWHTTNMGKYFQRHGKLKGKLNLQNA